MYAAPPKFSLPAGRVQKTFSGLFDLKYPAQQPPQAPGGTYHHDTHENASPPCWICR